MHTLCGAGFEQLVRLDERFRAFANTLFGAAHQENSKDREQYTQQEADAVDRTLAHFLDLLSPFVLRPAAFNTLEYLVRRFRCLQCCLAAAAAVPALGCFWRLTGFCCLQAAGLLMVVAPAGSTSTTSTA